MKTIKRTPGTIDITNVPPKGLRPLPSCAVCNEEVAVHDETPWTALGPMHLGCADRTTDTLADEAELPF
jgi:hypothetical protein